jgi:hypothetical protein
MNCLAYQTWITEHHEPVWVICLKYFHSPLPLTPTQHAIHPDLHLISSSMPSHPHPNPSSIHHHAAPTPTTPNPQKKNHAVMWIHPIRL